MTNRAETEMVERCARAVADKPELQSRDTFHYDYDQRPDEYQAIVRTVLEALRDPTPEMVEAAWPFSNTDGPVMDHFKSDLVDYWHAMIDAALAPPIPTKESDK